MNMASLIKEGVLEPRLYQQEIFKKAKKTNLMVVLPTGLGKTPIAVMLAAERLERFPESRVLVMAPTKPLVNQHRKTFGHFMDLPSREMEVVTGTVAPKKRKNAYLGKKIIFATPQTIQNDLKQGRLSLEGFSLLVIDEVHHGVGRYAYPFVAQKYLGTAEHPRILGLTASPASEEEKIREVCEKCGIDSIEIRTEHDEDVTPYVQQKRIQWVEVVLPDRFYQVKELLDKAYRERTEKLVRLGFLRSARVSKKRLLELQVKLVKAAKGGYKKAFMGLALVGRAIKIEHAITMLETQGVKPLEKYLKKLRSDAKAKSLLRDVNFSRAMALSKELYESGASHPKMGRLASLISSYLQEKPDAKIIVFAHFRDTVKEIVSVLGKVGGAEPVAFMGQKSLSQKEQIRILEDFREGKFNTLVGTSVHPDETIILKDEEGHITVRRIGDFVDFFLSKNESKKKVQGWFVLSSDGRRISFSRVTHVHKHRRNNKVLKIHLRSCGSSLVTENHSVFTFNARGEHVPTGPDLNLFVNTAFDAPNEESCLKVDLAKLLYKHSPKKIRTKIYCTFEGLSQVKVREIHSERKVLREIKKREKYVKEIAEVSNLDPSTVPHVLARLHKRGCVNITKKSRYLYAKITKRGLDYLSFLNSFCSSCVYRKRKYRVPLKNAVRYFPSDNESYKMYVEFSYGKTKLPRFIPLSEEMANFFGFFVSEGHVSTEGKYGQIFLSARKAEMQRRMLRSITEGFRLKAKTIKKGIFIRSKIFSLVIRYAFGCGSSAYEKSVPSAIFSAPNNIKWNFLESYFLGDGYRDVDRIVLTTISRKLATGLVFLMRQLGVKKITVHEEKRTRKNWRNVYRIKIYESLPFAKIMTKRGKRCYYDVVPTATFNRKAYSLYSNKFFPVSNKYIKSRKVSKTEIGNSFDYIKKMETLKNQPKYVYDLSVEDTERFFGGPGLICLHNSVSEEGLDIPAMDLAVFYEPVPSEIRSIQRRGRVGRQVAGDIIILITKGTRDEAYYWSAKSKEKRMKRLLYGMRGKKVGGQRTLRDI